LNTEDILRVEPEEGLERVEDSIKVCNSFMESYHTKKGDIASHFKEGQPVVEWSFNDELIFSRLNSYLSRLHIVEVKYQ
jgi:dynein heavy chain